MEEDLIISWWNLQPQQMNELRAILNFKPNKSMVKMWKTVEAPLKFIMY